MQSNKYHVIEKCCVIGRSGELRYQVSRAWKGTLSLTLRLHLTYRHDGPLTAGLLLHKPEFDEIAEDLGRDNMLVSMA
jgi:hypothetical protein